MVADAKLPTPTFKERATAWRDVYQIVGICVAIGLSLFNFWQANLHITNDLEVVAIGGVDQRLAPNKQDRISVRLALVNVGNREASVLQAEVVALYKGDQGYSWVRIFPAVGEGFDARTLKLGEISIISLVTDGYAYDYFMRPRYSRPIDVAHHEFVEGVRIKSMDADGHIYSVLYPISQYKVRNDFDGKGGPPSEGYTFDRSVHHLFVNEPEMIPPLAKEYKDDVP